jgi:Ca2+-binding RTX toxin-like protein
MRVRRAAITLGVLLGAGWSLPAGAGAAGAPSVRTVVTCDGRAATIVGTIHADVLRGTAGPDVIAGLGGNDTLKGIGGNDRICGGLGMDRLLGGPGDDRLSGGRDWVHVTDEGSTERVGDHLDGGNGDDLLLAGRDLRSADDVIPDSISWESATRGVHVDTTTGRATGQGHDRFDSRGDWIVGSAYADIITGSARSDLLSSGRGADEVHGLGGDDQIVTDPSGGRGGADLAVGGRGDDTISAHGGEDVLRGGEGDDVIDDMGPAADRMYGGPGADRLFTQITDVPAVDQVVDGGKGSEDFVDLHTQTINPATQPSTAVWSMLTGRLVYTQDHPVTLTVAHVERVDLSAWGTSWAVTGTAGPDTLLASGSWGTDFTGRQGQDTFMGSSYDDTFRGGAGDDHSLGMSAGTDTCSSVEVLDQGDCENVLP